MDERDFYEFSNQMPMRPLKKYHHFKAELLDDVDRVARCERYVVDLLLKSDVPEREREESVCWELKHQASTRQFAAILARKRGLPNDICVVGMLLHDIYAMVTGKYADHAHRGAPMAVDILKKVGGFRQDEMDQVHRIVFHHSDKHICTDDPFQEFGKDVDVLDCFLYDGAYDYYLANKPLEVFCGYVARARKVWKEMAIPSDPRFDVLDGYCVPWFQCFAILPRGEAEALLAMLIHCANGSDGVTTIVPPFCMVLNAETVSFYANDTALRRFAEKLQQTKSVLMNEPEQSRLFDFLKQGAGDKPRETVGLDSLAERDGLRFRRRLAEAQEVFNSGSIGGVKGEMGFVFWPLLGIYERLSETTISKRLREFGIVLEGKGSQS